MKSILVLAVPFVLAAAAYLHGGARAPGRGAGGWPEEEEKEKQW